MRGRTERDTCRDFVGPLLEATGWTDRYETERVVRAVRRLSGDSVATAIDDGRVDYLLEMVPGLPVGVIEAKREYSGPGQGLQQAVEYAVALDLPTAIASDGRSIRERDLTTGRERDLDAFPTPVELWDRYARYHRLDDDSALAIQQAFDRTLTNADGSVRELRYYQAVAVHRVLRAVTSGDRRALLLMATGSGKTLTALQLCRKLLSYWKAAEPGRNRRILYLADRDVLIGQPLTKYFRPAFGDAVARIQGERVMGREIYFATYQALAQGGDGDDLAESYPPDFFDLIVVDECHRGSVEGTSWRAILDRFSSAVQVGLTATPKRDTNVDTYEYFGEPVYEYSLRQGIEDGYLAPYRVRRVVLSPDADGWSPDEGERDRFGQEIPDGVYSTRDFERVLSMLARTRLAATHLSGILRSDPTARTIVFCVDSEHAEEMRRQLREVNPELVRADDDWVVRIVSAEGATGRRLLEEFSDPTSSSPVVATTSRMLSTGVDIEDLKYVVLFRAIGSMVEFKQIIGRGTRLYPENDKYSFEVVDYVGATAKFEDPGFDGPPVSRRVEVVDDDGEVIGDDDTVEAEVAEDQPDFTPGGSSEDGPPADGPQMTGGDASQVEPRRKYYVDGTDVVVTAEGLYVADTSTGRLRLVEYADYLADQVRRVSPSVDDFRARWSATHARAAMEDELAQRAIDVPDLAARLGLPEDVDPFDMLVHAAWNLPQRTRHERARLVREDHLNDLEGLVPQARAVVAALLQRYEEHGVDEMTHPHGLEVPPISELGSPAEIAAHFGGAQAWHETVADLQRWLYSA